MEYHLFTDYYYMMISLMFEFYKSLIPQGLFQAIIILVIGLIFAVEFSKLAERIVGKIGIDKILEKNGVKSFIKKSGIKFSIENLVGWIVKWFILLFALMTAVDFLGIGKASEFLNSILGYIPNLIGALVVLTIGLIVSRLVYESIEGGANATGIRIYHLAAIAAKWVIIVLTILVVLEQMELKTEILKIFTGGLSFMIALAGGIAFGLGGQYYAKELIDEFKSKIKK